VVTAVREAAVRPATHEPELGNLAKNQGERPSVQPRDSSLAFVKKLVDASELTVRCAPAALQ